MDINATIASSQGGGGDAQNEVKSTRFHPQMDENASTRSESNDKLNSNACSMNTTSLCPQNVVIMSQAVNRNVKMDDSATANRNVEKATFGHNRRKTNVHQSIGASFCTY